MERTTPTLAIEVNELQNRFMVLSAIASRMGLAQQMGLQTFGGDRNIMAVLGYPLNLTFADYFVRYSRQAMAKAIIDRPAKRTWKGEVLLVEVNDANDTQFEAAWKTLSKELKLKSAFSRLDRLTGLGRYGVLLLGFNGVNKIEDYTQPISGKVKLMYVRPLSEDSAKINTYDTEPSSPRYGMPVLYDLSFTDSTNGNSVSLKVHYTRVLHVVDDILESEVEGIPRLQGVFNNLLNIEKIEGGDAEMFWKGARPGYQGTVDKDFTLTTDIKNDLKEQIDEYEHGLRRMLISKGINYTALAQEIADPTAHLDIQIQIISAETNIPKRILTGSERGELSSGQDADEWANFIQDRRDEYAAPRIVRPFADYMIQLGILPKPKQEYVVQWEDLFAPSEAQKADVGVKRATALKEYTTNPAAAMVIPEAAFMEFFLGLTADQITLISQMSAEQIANEPEISPEEQAMIDAENNLPTE